MCGISALINTSGLSTANLEELRKISANMSARGPDGDGEWVSPCGTAALAHRRLAIIDPEPRSNQPMLSKDGRLSIAFNGEIYNYQEIRSVLEGMGYTFRTCSDTEVILSAYSVWRTEMFSRLRGMYALAIWDNDERELMVARDPYGIKPLYFSKQGRFLRVASQVKALIAGGRVSREPDINGVSGFLTYGTVPEPNTIYKDICAVPAGSYFLFRNDGSCSGPNRHTDLLDCFLKSGVAQEIQDFQSLTRQALTDSIGAHLVADVPVGAFLSAGIDSGAIVGMMREFGQRDMQTITLAFEQYRGTAWDESVLAEACARHYGTRHATRYITAREFKDDLPTILDDMDQPSVDGINTWYVSKAAAEQGLKVAVSGVGGDELFGGYRSFRQVPRISRAFANFNSLPGFGGFYEMSCAALSKVVPPLNRSPKISRLARYADSIAGAYFIKKAQFMPDELDSLFADPIGQRVDRSFNPIEYTSKFDLGGGCYDWTRVAALEASLYMRNQLLRDTDWASMAHSLEVRVPMTDFRLLEMLAPALSGFKHPPGKSFIANSPDKKLPDDIVKRRKSGFQIPIGDWTAQLDLPPLPKNINWGSHWSRAWAYRLVAMHPDLRELVV